MITVIRDRFKSYATRVLLGVLTATLVIGLLDFGVRKSGADNDGSGWALRINGQEISQQAFARNVAKQEENLQALREQYGAYADEFLRTLGADQAPQRLALAEIKRDTVLNQLAASIPLYVHHEYLEQKINNPQFMYQSGLAEIVPLGVYTPQGLDEGRLKRYLMRTNLTTQHIEHLLEQGLARYMSLELASLGAFIPEKSLQATYARKNALRKYALFTFPLDTYIKQERAHEIKPDELKAFFDRENSVNKRYWVPEKRAGKIWKVTPEEYGIEIKDSSIKDYYEKNKVYKYVQKPAHVEVRRILFKVSDAETKDAVWEQAKAVHQEVTQNPSAFAAKAKEVSQDELTAKNGGLMAPFAKGQKDPAFERKSFMLPKEHDISEPFETTEGIQIVQLVSKQPTQFKDLAEVKKEIERTLIAQKFGKRFARDFKHTYNASEQQEADLQAFIQKAKGVATPQELKAQDDSKIMRELFRLKKGKAGIFVDQNVGYIVQLTDIQKRHLPNLESIESTVKDDFIQDRAMKKLQEQIELAKKALGTESLHKVAKEFNATVVETEFVKPDDNSMVEKLKKYGLAPELLFQLEKRGEAIAQTEHDGYLITVTDVRLSDEKGADGVPKEQAAKALYERKSLFLQGFIASLSRNATIEVNQTLSTLYEK
jgi:parvulin-like peptidyl-prolyl isomerase